MTDKFFRLSAYNLALCRAGGGGGEGGERFLAESMPGDTFDYTAGACSFSSEFSICK